jgi:hypothetical protein
MARLTNVSGQPVLIADLFQLGSETVQIRR